MLSRAAITTELEKELLKKLKYEEKTLAAIIASRNSDTKSSAGDKFETAREMAQIEINKQEIQIEKNKQFLNTIKKQEGSLITTDKGVFFILIPYGTLQVNDATVFCISEQAPITKLLLTTKAGSAFTFGTHTYTIN